ncbi:MAG: hypothetical protein ACOC8N_00070 [Spirochaetota bacterium]
MTDHARTTTSAWTRHTRRLRYPYLAAAAAMAVLLLAVSLLPHRAIERSAYPQVSDLFDAANHFAGFTLFSFLLLSALSGLEGGLSAATLRRYALIALFWGALCEGSQLLQATRGFQLLDLAANLLPVPLFVGILRRRTSG